MLQNLKMLGNSIAQTTVLDQFEDNQEQDHGDTGGNGYWEPKNDNDTENAVQIKFTKKPPRTYQKKKNGKKKKGVGRGKKLDLK